MEIYRVGENELSRIPASALDTEQELEEHLIKSRGAVIGDIELMYIDRQGTPDEGGIFDILAVDRNGDLVIVELKRDKTPRDIVAQALEYASSLRNDEYTTLNNRFHEFLRSHGLYNGEKGDELPSLQDGHSSYFNREEDPVPNRAFNTDQRLVLVGTEFRTVSLNMADFLRDHRIDVVCVEYESFSGGDDGINLLTTQSIRRPLSKEPTGTSTDAGMTEDDRIRYEFWEDVADEISSREGPISSVSPAKTRYRFPVSFDYGASIKTILNTGEQRAYVILRISDDRELYAELKQEQGGIESRFDEGLKWIPPEETRAREGKELCKIQVSRSMDLDAQSNWDETVEWIVDQTEQFHMVFRDRLTE